MYFRILTLVMILSSFWANIVFAAVAPPTVDAEAAVLMEANTNQVLFGKKPDGIMYPASTTKIMTLLIALEKGNPNSIVTVSPRAAACEESRLGLNTGDKLKLRDAEYGMMLVSGNDAADAIAENVGGSIPAFVDMMNAKAIQLGTVNTNFSNPHGLPDPYNHYTTAHDLGLIASYAMKNPDFVNIVSTREYNVKFLNRASLDVTNIDKLLKIYPGANGIKTGYTHDAGECLVAGAKRGGVQLIAVVLNSNHRWDDAAALLNYGFSRLGL